MARRLTNGDREAKALRAWEMSVQGHHNGHISDELGISRGCVIRLIKEQRQRVVEETAASRAEFMADFTAQQTAAMASSWKFGNDPKQSNTSRAPHLSNYIKSSELVAKARGLFIERLAAVNKDGDIVDPLDGLRALIGSAER